MGGDNLSNNILPTGKAEGLGIFKIMPSFPKEPGKIFKLPLLGDWSLITGEGGYKTGWGWGACEVLPLQIGGHNKI